MRKSNIKLEWYVLMRDFNSDKIVDYNIFGQSFIDELYKEYKKKKITNFEQLKDFVNKYCMYRYWAKCECEILVGGLFSDWDKYEKIDAYRQIKMNLDRITEYVNNRLKVIT